MKKDLVIGIVGTLILLTAMVGVFRYEAAQRGQAFEVTWATSEVAGTPLEGATSEGSPTLQPVNVTQLNVTRVEFRLEWTDDNANTAPDEFEVTVTSPDGRSATQTGSAGSVVVVIENLSGPPALLQTTGASEESVRDSLAREHSSRVGTGTWNVTITVNAGDVAAGPIPPQLQDTGNSWTLTTVVTVYEARLAPA